MKSIGDKEIPNPENPSIFHKCKQGWEAGITLNQNNGISKGCKRIGPRIRQKFSMDQNKGRTSCHQSSERIYILQKKLSHSGNRGNPRYWNRSPENFSNSLRCYITHLVKKCMGRCQPLWSYQYLWEDKPHILTTLRRANLSSTRLNYAYRLKGELIGTICRVHALNRP